MSTASTSQKPLQKKSKSNNLKKTQINIKEQIKKMLKGEQSGRKQRTQVQSE